MTVREGTVEPAVESRTDRRSVLASRSWPRASIAPRDASARGGSSRFVAITDRAPQVHCQTSQARTVR